MKKWLVFIFSPVLIVFGFFFWLKPHPLDVKAVDEQNQSVNEERQRNIEAAPSAQPSIVGSRSVDARTGEEKPVDTRSQAGAALKPLDDDLMKRVSSLAWISSPGSLEPESSDFDQKILDKSMNSPGWRPYKELRNGIYAGILETKGANPTSSPFWIDLNAGGPNGIQALWMRWSDEGSVGTLFNLAFTSSFSGQEVYLKAIHLPSIPFIGRGIEAGACKEVLLIPYSETSTDVKYIDSISSKAFCRKGAQSLTPIGQMAFVFDHSE